MSSYRNTRGVDVSMGEETNLDSKRAQWGMYTAGRVLDCLFPEVPLGDGNSVEGNSLNKHIEYNADTLAEVAKRYFQNIYHACSNGTPIIPDIEDFCLFANLSRYQFVKYCSSHDFLLALCAQKIRNCIASCKKQMAFDGQIPPVVFAIDFNNNHDYVQARNCIQIQAEFEGEVQQSIDDIASRLPIQKSDNQ